MAFIEGFAVGLGLVILVGPVLFVLVGITLEKGRTAGLAVAAGIFLSDILAVGLCVLGFANWLSSKDANLYISLAGGILLLGLGFRYFWMAPLSIKTDFSYSSFALWKSFGEGFLVNFVNPFVFVVWLSIIAAASGRYGVGGDLYLFLTGCVLAVLTLDISKVFLANRIKGFLNPKSLNWIFKGSGILVALLGVRLILEGYF